MKKALFCGVFLLLFSSCAKSDTFISQKSRAKNVPLFIKEPTSRTVYYNLGPLLYDAMWNRFSHAGYKLDDQESNNNIVETKIISYEVPEKNISPDLTLYAQRIKITLRCSLATQHDSLKQEKEFSCSCLVHSAKNQVFRSSFFNYELERLCQRVSIKIDHWVRSLLPKGS